MINLVEIPTADLIQVLQVHLVHHRLVDLVGSQGHQVLCLRRRYHRKNYSVVSLVVVWEVRSVRISTYIYISQSVYETVVLIECARPYAGGPQFVFNMGGGPGFRVHQFGGARPRRRPTRETNTQSEPMPSAWDILRQFLPLFLLFIIPLISSFFSGPSASVGPSYRFDAAVPPHIMQRTTPRLNVNYFVDPADVEDYSARKFHQLDQKAEVEYVSKVRFECENEIRVRDRMIQDAQGWFFPDVDKLKAARSMKLRSCKKFDNLNLRSRY